MNQNNYSIDFFKDAVLTLCKVKDIPERMVVFRKGEVGINITVKHQSKDGNYINLLNVLDVIYNLVGPTGIKFHQSTFKTPSEEIDKVSISFEEDEYKKLNAVLQNEKA